MVCWVFCTCDDVVGGKQEYCSKIMVVRGACKASAPLVDATITEAVSTSTVAKNVLFLAGLHRNLQVLATLGCMCEHFDHLYLIFLCYL